MDLQIKSHIAVIFGAAGGTAHEAARIMRVDGCNLVQAGIDEDELTQVADSIVTVVADLGEQAGVDKVAQALTVAGGRADVLVHAAGITGAKDESLADITDGIMEKHSEKKSVRFDKAGQTFREGERPHLALKRRGRREDVAIACLRSERASFVTGSNWRVDGGAVQAMSI